MISNNGNLKTKKPYIFIKKLSDNMKIIPLNKTTNTLGPMRYFPPATKEWFNSIYAYNKIYTKNITMADKNLSRLLKSYFNLYFNKKLLSSKRILTRFRRTAINKLFISKAELKHTSSKIIITLYIYNEERRVLLNRLKRLEAILFPSFIFISKEDYKNKLSSLNKKLDIIKRIKENLSFKDWLRDIIEYNLEEIKLNKKALETINKLNLKDKKLLEIETLKKHIKNISVIITSCENDPISYMNYERIYNKYISKSIIEKEIIAIAYYKLLLSLNKSKFEDKFLLKLKPFISKIYNKEVEFNIVNLKAIYLNSDIFTQAISLKLRNRNNRLLKVLRYFLYMAKLPKINLLKERFAHINIKNLWINRVKNLTINSLDFYETRDNINQLLTSIFTKANFLKKSEGAGSVNENNLSIDIASYVINNLKHKSMGGIRLEAKGRLTRRFTASRSVFKIKWKGSLKNIDSSYRGLSSVILRGHIKSNVQYSIINSKTRNGAFGLKGWISGK
jgi:Mitochondrial ribosomal protein (VAR1)